MIKQRYSGVIRSIIFLSIVVFTFITISYIFRPLSYARTSAMGLSVSEPIDAVFIGSSVMRMSYAPMAAFEQEGIVTYSFTWDALTAESIKYAVKEVYKSQEPKLLVIDLKPFEYRDLKGANIEAEIRNFSDAIPYSVNRLEYILEVVPDNVAEEENKNPLNYIFDISKYHTRWTMLGGDAIRSWNNSVRSINKGFGYSTNVSTTDGYIDNSNVTNKVAQSDYIQEIFAELIDYLDTLDCEVLFLVTTYSEPVKHREHYNFYAEIIEEAGYDYINMNDHQDSVNIDFDNDFYDGVHLNLQGALKYTSYLAKYIKDEYNLLDRSEDSTYSKWHEDYREWYDSLDL